MFSGKGRYLITMCLAFAAALLLVNGLGSFYYDMPLRTTNYDGFTPHKYKTRAHNPYYNREGYGDVNIDAWGFNNQVSFAREEADIVCMGSSQTLSIGLRTEQNFVSLLNQDNKECRAYNVGVSDCTLARSLYRAPLIKKFFPNCKQIVLETPSLPNLQALEAMKEVLLSGSVPVINLAAQDKIPSFVKNRPLLRLLHMGLQAVVENGRPGAGEIKDEYRNQDFLDPRYAQLADEVFRLTRKQLGSMPVLVMFIPQYRLDRAGRISIIADPRQENIIKDACQAHGFTYLSLGPAFIEQYNDHRIQSLGFTNSHIGTGHLNAAGSRLTAAILEKALKKEGVY